MIKFVVTKPIARKLQPSIPQTKMGWLKTDWAGLGRERFVSFSRFFNLFLPNQTRVAGIIYCIPAPAYAPVIVTRIPRFSVISATRAGGIMAEFTEYNEYTRARGKILSDDQNKIKRISV